MIKHIFLLLLSTLVSINYGVYCQDINKIKIYTEDYYPYNYLENDKLSGISTDIMVEMLKRVKSNITLTDINLVPWSRGYILTLNQRNSCLYSVTRSNEREKKFKWIGPIGNISVSLLALKSQNIEIKTESDLNKYKIGAGKDDIGEQLLIKSEISDLKLVTISGQDIISRSLKLLNTGRIDLFCYGEFPVQKYLIDNNLDSNIYEFVYTLEKNELYYAFNIDTPDYIVSTFREAFNSIKEDGTYNLIINNYYSRNNY